jgi:Ser-tRNA(Ala) deacylase AlaX
MQQIQSYLDDTYRFQASSEIIEHGCDEMGEWFALKNNIFHPQGGGQPADIGWVNNIPVKVCRHSSGHIVVYPESSVILNGHEQVHSKLSVSDRLCHAALHTAGHLLNWELRQYGWQANAGHHFPGQSRVEFTAMGASTIPVDQLPVNEIEAGIIARMQGGGAVQTWFEGETRYCLIDGTENMPCAGTHVDNLNKLTGFKIKSVKFKKSTLRISYDAAHTELRI